MTKDEAITTFNAELKKFDSLPNFFTTSESDDLPDKNCSVIKSITKHGYVIAMAYNKHGYDLYIKHLESGKYRKFVDMDKPLV